MARQRQAPRIHAPRKEAAAPLCSPRPHTLSTDCATASLLAAGVALVGMVMLTRVNPHISFWDADPAPDVHGSSTAAPAVTLPTLPLHRHLDRIAAFEAAGELIEAVAYTTAVRGVANSTAHTLSTLDVLGRLQRALRLHGDAYATHATALALKGQSGATVGQYLISYTEMITDRYLDFKFDAAMLLLAHTRKTLQTALSAEAAALLDKMEAFVR
eukprot:m.323332 g.323332  ORF g.323332 m.323332 type:complete len:215 (+) comp27624_c0_seq9:249-893(+)